MDEVTNSTPPMPVNYQYSIYDGVLKVVTESMGKARACRDSGFKENYLLLRERAWGAIAVYRFIESGPESEKEFGEILNAFGDQRFKDTMFKRDEKCLIDAVNEIVRSGLMIESNEIYDPGYVRGLGKEMAIGAFNVFDLCTSKEEKAAHRSEILGSIFPVGKENEV
jgi:hypothetical protein